MAYSKAADKGDNTQQPAQQDLSVDDEASCELMLEALQEHLRSIEVRINLAY